MNIVSKLAGLVITLYLARFLGPAQLGYFSFVAAVASLFGLVFSVGIPGYVQNHVPALISRGRELEAKKLLGASRRIVFLSSILALIFAVLFGFVAQEFLHRDAGLLLFSLAGMYATVLVLYYFGESALISLHKLYLALRAAIARDVFRVVLVVLLTYVFRSFVPAVLAYIITFGAYVYVILKIVQKYSAASGDYSLLRDALPYLFFGLATMFLAYTDVLMLSYFRPISDVGYYKIAQLIITSTISVLPIVAVSLPTLSRAAASGQLRRKFLQLVLFAVVVAIFADVLLYLFGPPLILFFVGREYVLSISVLYALLPLIPFYFIYALGVQAIIALGREKEQVIYPLFAGAINVVLNYILIQRYGTVGAAMATSASMGVAALLVLGRLLLIKHISQRAS